MEEGASNHALRDFNKALQKYLRYNKRDTGPLIENRGKKIQWELYRQFKAIAPTREKIDQYAEAVGFAIKRRIGPDGKRLSVKQELALRKRSIRYLSVSYLFRAWRTNREGQNSRYPAKSRRNQFIGEALIRTAKGQRNPIVRLTSFLKGVLVQNRKRNLVDKALNAQTADMQKYIQRKQREAIKRTISGLFR